MGISELVGVVFIVLKILGFITWPWVWVAAPLWVPLVIYFLIYLTIFILAVIE
jgi:hypothetical protein